MNKHDEEIESAILGACLLENEAIEVVINFLKPNHFNNNNHKLVYRAIYDLYKNKETIDILTVTDKLKTENVLESMGGAYYVSQLINKIGSHANIEAHARIIVQYSILRELELMAKKIESKTNESIADCFEILEWVQKECRNIEDGLKFNSSERIDAIRDVLLAEISESIKTGKKSGIMSNIGSLDAQTSGWQKSDLIILAGRPAMGKTSAAVQFALNPALNGIPTAFFSLEMSKNQLANRILSLVSDMNVQKIVTKNLTIYDYDLLERDGKVLNEVPFFIDDKPSMNILELSSKARRLKREHKIQLIVIDYLQLMRGNGQNREGEISEISRGLKILAKELNIPIIALSQLSRAVELRADKKPVLSDLRESGAIEQDADMVIFTFRPEYYDFPSYRLGENEYPSDGLMIFIISKFRQGQTGEIKARWIGELTKVTNY